MQAGVAQQLYLGNLLEALLVGAVCRNGLDKGASFLHLALASQQIGASGLHAEQVGGIGNALQIDVGFVVALALLGQIGPEQIELGFASSAPHALRQLGQQRAELCQGNVGSIQLAILQLQIGEHDPGFGEFGRFAGDELQLVFGIGIALLSLQHAGIGQAQLGRMILFKIALDQRLHFGGA
ncbi:hypothetical protein SDC9_140338 [bioreactor metagenome]|uniref:Uncharacterized protein n=1 Tax=bioreactor metagenome TaxID=1076179 RepID=A0A645DXZ1_9ZZZZ